MNGVKDDRALDEEKRAVALLLRYRLAPHGANAALLVDQLELLRPKLLLQDGPKALAERGTATAKMEFDQNFPERPAPPACIDLLGETSDRSSKGGDV